MSDIDEILKQAQLANFDNECTSMVILMVCKGDPEAHIAIRGEDVFVMNGAVDMFKTDITKLMHECTQGMKPRE
jgi:hypothetical protein